MDYNHKTRDGAWTILRHRAENLADTTFGVAFQYSFASESERLLDVRKTVESLIDGNYPEVESGWPAPDLEEIAKQAEFADNLSMMYFDTQDLRIISHNDLWKVTQHQDMFFATVERMSCGEADLEIIDLRDESFSFRVRTESGVFNLYSDGVEQPKVKFWDFEVLAALQGEKNRAYQWWEY